MVQFVFFSPPDLQLASKQKSWDNLVSSTLLNIVMNNCNSLLDKTRLLACQESESSAWLNAYPSTNTGQLLDDKSLQITYGVRLGLAFRVPLSCVCGATVDTYSLHELSCYRSEGKVRHSIINDIIKQALLSAGIPSILEPSGCSRTDGKKPDGMSLVPWKRGKALV